MDSYVEELKADIKRTLRYKKETEQKMEMDAQIDGVDLFPHMMTINMFRDHADGMKYALRLYRKHVKKGN
jgi:hypothetical protein